jgi:hypothetical protein
MTVILFLNAASWILFFNEVSIVQAPLYPFVLFFDPDPFPYRVSHDCTSRQQAYFLLVRYSLTHPSCHRPDPSKVPFKADTLMQCLVTFWFRFIVLRLELPILRITFCEGR